MDSLIQKRKILVYNQPKQKFVVIETSSTKWSEIAELIKASTELEIRNLDSMRAVVSSTQVTLELPNAEVPDGDQKIFLFEAKVKSGAKATSVYSEMSFTDLRRLAKEKGIGGSLGSNPSKADLVKALEKGVGIKKEKVAKVSKTTGKTRNVTVTEKAPNADKLMKVDAELVEKLRNLEIRTGSIEQAFAKLVNSLYETASDFVKPTAVEVIAKVVAPVIEAKREKISESDIDLDALNREASKLRV
jgi:hypothetical protein